MKKLIKKLLITNIASFGLIAQVYASNPIESGVVPVCGVLESFIGHVQVFDATRSQVVDVMPKQKLLCGSWVSVEDGVAFLSHAQGFEVQIGARSFVQILDPASGSQNDKDHFTLLRGQMVLKSPQKKALQVSTANARVIANQAEAFLLYSTDYNETQVLGISGQTEIQNRYLETRGIRVSQSQYSTLDFNPNRPTPAQPKVVAMKLIQERLQNLGVSKDLSSQMLGEAKALVQTQLPVSLKSDMPERGLASVSEHPEFPREQQKVQPTQDHFLGQSENVISKNTPKVIQRPTVAHGKPMAKGASRRTPASVEAKGDSEKQMLLKKLSEIEIEE
jgi:hypothetical protein